MYNLYRQQCPPATFSYIIKPNDTLYSLARRFNTTVAAIISANPFIKPEDLQIGQSICIPTQLVYPPCPEGNYYTIRPGDTLYSIAQSFNISLADLTEANPLLNPNFLIVGQVICIPLAVPTFACPGGEYYKIQSGDTFYSIARQFNVTVEGLQIANPSVDPVRLLIGQIICIPVAPIPIPCPENNYYTIGRGDTFYSIARRFNVTVDDLRRLNPNVDPAGLLVGQIICIPVAPEPTTCPQNNYYTIAPRDTLYDIAARFNTNVRAIIALNPGINPFDLRVGQRICIPIND